MLTYRDAQPADAAGMAQILRDIIALTGRMRASDAAYCLATYIENPASVCCTVAIDGAEQVVGFQSLTIAGPDSAYGTPEGWGAIGTHVSPDAHGQGVGRALFACTLAAARHAGVTQIDASIGADNPEGQAYYAAMGFQTWQTANGRVQKVYRVAQ
ncbi:GCN5-related N-acetyltransferase [Ketogulonicigenium robustum]|uniref:GCN5-related N-acetyltransferase n=1 Tax=Ketogulonicigenium robustum TaxID=92947 RepID=A0A1W6P0J6_9RHOB|nr:GNAT family N-acetyltransferase [Ketogulonicigenium robustum]ARO14969.1 GCN5-related N-acetyltransferase [Ketogulonicigenium robustum]